MFVKIHKNIKGSVLACCDKKLLNKILKEGKIELKISESFYKGKEINEKELEKLLEEYENINLFGENQAKIAIKKGLISKEDILYINGIPHVIIMKI